MDWQHIKQIEQLYAEYLTEKNRFVSCGEWIAILELSPETNEAAQHVKCIKIFKRWVPSETIDCISPLHKPGIIYRVNEIVKPDMLDEVYSHYGNIKSAYYAVQPPNYSGFWPEYRDDGYILNCRLYVGGRRTGMRLEDMM